MKQKRLLIMLIMAVTSGVLAGYLALSYLRGQAGAPRPATAEAVKGKLAVAVKDLPMGAILRLEDVRLIDWPDAALPPGYAASSAEVVGRGLITPVTANEPLLKTKLSTKEEGGGLPIIIPEGMRGVSVKVNEVIGVAGFVRPQSRVDVLVTVNPPKEEGALETPITRVILQNVTVLASGQSYQYSAEGEPQTVSVVTLLVNPVDAERLTLAASEGRIQLALRNTLDLEEVETHGIRTAALIGDADPPRRVNRTVRTSPRGSGSAVVRDQEDGMVVETLRGGQRTLQTFSPGKQ